MALSGSLSTGSYSGRYYTLSWTATQNVSTNKSTISWTLKAVGGTSSWFAERTLKVVIAGTTVYSKTARVERYAGTVTSGTITLAHNTDGSKSFSASVQAAVYTSSVNCTGSKTFTLDSIPRAATITSAPNFTDEDNPTISYSNPAGSAVSKLEACVSFTGALDDIAYRDIPISDTSYTFNLTDAERKVLQNACTTAKSMTVYFFIATTLGGTIYRNSVAKTLTIANAEPTLSPTVKDTNATTKALTGDEAKFIKGYSNAAFTVGASVKKSATIKSQGATCGEKSSSSASGTLSAVEGAEFVFSVTDSRGYTTTKTLTKTLIDYVALTCSMKVGTPTADGKCAMQINGQCFNGTFGAVANTLTVQYRRSTDGGNTWGAWTDAAATKSGNSYSAEVAITGLDYQQAYTFQARAVDKLATVPTATKTVKAFPVFDWGEDEFNFNVPVHLQNSKALYGNNASGTPRNLVHINGSNASNFGYGGYAASEGSTGLYGNEVGIFSKNGVYIDGNLAATIVAEGVSGIWTYRKWASGLAECWGVKTVTTNGFSAWGGMYICWAGSGAVSLPFTFAEVPTFECSATSDTTSSLGVVAYGGTTTVTPSVEVFRSNNPGAIAVKYQFVVRGRWK